jgi:hypothetical protein
MRPCAQLDVLSAQSDQFRVAQPSLQRNLEQQEITPPQPGPGIRGFQKRGRFHFTQELHRPSFEALWRDGQNTLTVIGEGGFVNGNVPEEGVDCAQAIIASASTVVAIVLKVLEECGHELGIQILHPKVAGLSAVMLDRKLQQKSEGVPVTGHRVVAGTQLAMQAAGEELLEVLGEVGDTHCRPPCFAVNWNSVASSRSSGTASMYQ